MSTGEAAARARARLIGLLRRIAGPGSPAQRADRLLPVAAGIAVGVFLLWSLIQIQAIINLLYLNGDSASAFTLAELLDDRGDGNVLLGNYLWLEPLYLLHWTKDLPYHRQLWEALPFLAYGTTVLLSGWTILRAAGRRPAIAAVLLLAVPSPIVLSFVAAPNAHGHTVLHTALLAAFLATAPAVGARRVPLQLAWGLAIAVTFAPGAASDVLALLGGGFAFAVAIVAGAAVRLLRWRTAVIGVAAVALGALGGHELVALAKDDGIVAARKVHLLVGLDQVVAHSRLLLESLGLFVHGRFGGELGAWNLAKTVVGLAAVLGVLFAATRVARPVRDALLDPGRTPVARLLLVFWLVTGLATAFAFIVTDAATDILGSRYLLAVWPALVAVPLIVSPVRATRGAFAVAVLCGVMGSVALGHGEYQKTSTPFPPGRDVGDLRRFVEAEGLSHGYASYWDAATITWQSHFKVKAYPVTACGDGRCPMFLHRIDEWYVPKPGRVRTFYIVDALPLPIPAGGPPERWGRPAKTATFGQLTIHVYDYDLATRLPEGT